MNNIIESYGNNKHTRFGYGHGNGVGSGNGYSVLEIINAFKDLGVEVPYKFYPRREGDIQKIYGDISKAKDVMSWSPKRTIIDSVNSILSSLK